MVEKKDIIDYVMTTIYNPNPAVLGSLLDQLASSDSEGDDSEQGQLAPTEEDCIDVAINSSGTLAKGSHIYTAYYCGINNGVFGMHKAQHNSLSDDSASSSTVIKVYCPAGEKAFVGIDYDITTALTASVDKGTIVVNQGGNIIQGAIVENQATKLAGDVTITLTYSALSI